MCCNNSQSNQCCKKTKTKECDSEELVYQIDAKEIYYKLKGDCFSNLGHFDIPKGADLEYILERTFNFLENLSYFEVTPNQYDAPDFKTLMDSLITDINLIRKCCEQKQEQVDALTERINLLENRINSVEFPNIIDTRGLGFTINSPLKTILQTISNVG